MSFPGFGSAVACSPCLANSIRLRSIGTYGVVADLRASGNDSEMPFGLEKDMGFLWGAIGGVAGCVLRRASEVGRGTNLRRDPHESRSDGLFSPKRIKLVRNRSPNSILCLLFVIIAIAVAEFSG